MSPIFILAFIFSIILLSASALKWALPFKKSFIIILLSTILSCLIALFLKNIGVADIFMSLLFLIFQFVFYVGILLYLFFRDPERIPPASPNKLASPADGTIIYIRKIPAGEILTSEKKGSVLIYDELRNSKLNTSELWQIGISLLFTDVHINRSPVSGKVTLLNHRPGKFLSLRNKDAVNVNERQTIVIDNKNITIGLVQIASRLVRRIEAYIRENEEIKIGQKIGMIKFGSQVDVFLPFEKISAVNVKVGDYILAGESTIATIVE